VGNIQAFRFLTFYLLSLRKQIVLFIWTGISEQFSIPTW
jgi:hypothetical protein